MGASPAPKGFQQKLYQALKGIPRIKTITDDKVGEADDMNLKKNLL